MQLTPVFLLGECHGQSEPAGVQSMGWQSRTRLSMFHLHMPEIQLIFFFSPPIILKCKNHWKLVGHTKTCQGREVAHGPFHAESWSGMLERKVKCLFKVGRGMERRRGRGSCSELYSFNEVWSRLQLKLMNCQRQRFCMEETRKLVCRKNPGAWDWVEILQRRDGVDQGEGSEALPGSWVLKRMIRDCQFI